MSNNWIYVQTEPRLWTVGHYGPDGNFMPESDHSTPQEAADRIRILNGGAPTEPQVGPDWDLRIYEGSEFSTVLPVDSVEISLTEHGLIRIRASHEESFGTWEVGKGSRIILGPEVQDADWERLTQSPIPTDAGGGHTDACLQRQDQRLTERAHWKYTWENHCTKCEGAGGHGYTENLAGHGDPPIMEDFFEPCEDCLDKGFCPRCGCEQPHMHSIDEDGCFWCNWDHGKGKDDICPPPWDGDCGCDDPTLMHVTYIPEGFDLIDEEE